MPVYEFKCSTCERTHEALLRMSDPDLTTFKDCAGDGRFCEIERLFSVAALRCSGVDNSEELLNRGKQTIHQPGQTITRDFMTPDGKMHPMKAGEYDPRFVGTNA